METLREFRDYLDGKYETKWIDKACNWLESVNLDFYQIREGVFSRQLVKDFRKYMKGE